MTDNRMILVFRKTRLEELVRQHNTVGQARFYLEHFGQDFSEYLEEHDDYKRKLDSIYAMLQTSYKTALVDRELISTFRFEDNDLVYVFGQDGLVANTIRYLNGQNVIGINPSSGRWVGLLLPFSPDNIKSLNPENILKTSRVREATLGEAVFPDGQRLYAVNDFYIGQRSHVSSRYSLHYKGVSENQSSSGIIVSTGVGSSGWLKSLISGATRLSKAAADNNVHITDDASFDWSSRKLVFVVREPYISPTSGAEIVYGEIDEKNTLKITSAMADDGIVFSDGMEKDCFQFPGGQTLTIQISDKTGKLLFPEYS